MLDYKILKPRKNTSPNSPLLVMLHGYGADMNDLFGFASMLPEELYILQTRDMITIKKKEHLNVFVESAVVLLASLARGKRAGLQLR